MFHFGLLGLNDISVYLESRRTTWTLFMYRPKYLHDDNFLKKHKLFFIISKVKIILTRVYFCIFTNFSQTP